MNYTCIDYTVEGSVATVTLDRPQSLNAREESGPAHQRRSRRATDRA